MARVASPASLGLGIVFLALGALSIADANRITNHVRKPGTFDVLGPDGYIFYVGILLIVLAGILGFVSLRQEAQPSRQCAQSARSHVYLLIFAVTALYAALVPIVGYTAATALYFVSALRVLGGRTWPADLSSAMILTIMFYTAFVYFADLPMPRGWLFD